MKYDKNFVISNRDRFEREMTKEVADQITMIVDNWFKFGGKPKLKKVRPGEHFKRFSIPVMEGMHVDFFLIRHTMGMYLIRFAEIVNKIEEEKK